ncbi:hypothetical protein [Streptomyces lavendofoliae]|uniref:Uncharacterized protein n=1 Tax=Streptomyces lavendofoliae TaxID=67314 RepID=A0A918I2B2_9ACTN|nr:hypothetical protein [Streptomyces lavendofoliae]GGU61169.1 hypothetical protein GCM10010274_57500 [Streptomyces lavendofoliae]
MTAELDTDARLEADIEEFSTHDRKGGWARAYLVARRVQPDSGRGVEIEQSSTKRHSRDIFLRVDAREFARRSKTSPNRILAFFAAWQRAAADGLVPPAEDLTLSSSVDLPDEGEVPFFGEAGYYRSYETRMPKGERREAIEDEAERAGLKPTDPVYIAHRPKALKTAILADDATRMVAKEAIEEYERRQDLADQEDRVQARLVEQSRRTPHDPQQDAELIRAVQAQATPEEVAMQVFTDLTQARLSTLNALTLLKRNNLTFSDQRAAAMREMCDSTQAAVDFIRDLVNSKALNDDDLRRFLDESEHLK